VLLEVTGGHPLIWTPRLGERPARRVGRGLREPLGGSRPPSRFRRRWYPRKPKPRVSRTFVPVRRGEGPGTRWSGNFRRSFSRAGDHSEERQVRCCGAVLGGNRKGVHAYKARDGVVRHARSVPSGPGKAARPARGEVVRRRADGPGRGARTATAAGSGSCDVAQGVVGEPDQPVDRRVVAACPGCRPVDSRRRQPAVLRAHVVVRGRHGRRPRGLRRGGVRGIGGTDVSAAGRRQRRGPSFSSRRKVERR
jgi:hypothetical protein